jgi:hypothetical protein
MKSLVSILVPGYKEFANTIRSVIAPKLCLMVCICIREFMIGCRYHNGYCTKADLRLLIDGPRRKRFNKVAADRGLPVDSAARSGPYAGAGRRAIS